MKTCKKCGVAKDPTEFYKRSTGKMSLICKECVGNRAAELRERRRQAAEFGFDVPRYQATRESQKISDRKYRRNNLVKKRAQELVAYAIQTGKLLREPCEVCGGGPAQAT